MTYQPCPFIHTHTHFITTIMYHDICLFCYSPPSIIFFLSFISRQCWNHLIKDDIIPPLNLTPTCLVSYFVRFSYPYNPHLHENPYNLICILRHRVLKQSKKNLDSITHVCRLDSWIKFKYIVVLNLIVFRNYNIICFLLIKYNHIFEFN